MAYTRAEIEAALNRFQQASATSAQSGDWREWADCFTEDAEYYEHHYGRLHGRQAILEWITDTMRAFPNSSMTEFPVDWYVIDEERGWVLMSVWNRMADPGDGTLHQEYNWTMLHYGGDGRFSYEEDMYNPAEFGTMIKGWLAARSRARGDRPETR